MYSFAGMTDPQIVQYALYHQDEMGCHDLCPDDFVPALRNGSTVIERREFGFAIINPESSSGRGSPVPHLWLIYVSPNMRSQGLGSRFVDDLVNHFSARFSMTALVFGERRVHFFERCGFHTVEQDRTSGWRTMQAHR